MNSYFEISKLFSYLTEILKQSELKTDTIANYSLLLIITLQINYTIVVSREDYVHF